MAHSILVVDDDPHIRDVVRFAFEKTGMTISIAHDGKEALRQFDRNVHDLVVLDIGMPEMDGLEVCRQIRKTSDTPILFLSARDEEIDRILGLEIGGDDYVTKPFSPRELVARVNAILRRARNAPAPAAAKAMSHGGLAIDPDARTAAFDRHAGGADGAGIRHPAHAAGAAGLRVHARTDPGCRLCRQHPCRRPHHRQPRPQHPRQDGGGRLRIRDRDRPWRRLQARTLRGGALTDASNDRRRTRPPRKWRPRLSLVVFLVLASVLSLPLFSLYFLKIYQNQLIQQTEAELIAQSAALAAVFHREIETAIPQGVALGAKVAPSRKSRRTIPISRSGRSWNWRTRACCRRGRRRAPPPRRPIPPLSRSARA